MVRHFRGARLARPAWTLSPSVADDRLLIADVTVVDVESERRLGTGERHG